MLWVIISILAVLAGIVLCLLFAPVVIEINTHNGLYRIGLYGLWGRIYLVDAEIWVELKFARWKKDINIFNLPTTLSLKEGFMVNEGEGEGKKKQPFKPKWKILKELLKSFKIVKLSWTLDTDDYVLNAQLYPLFYLTKNFTNHNISINFQGENGLVLIVKNNAWRVLKAILKTSKTHTK